MKLFQCTVFPTELSAFPRPGLRHRLQQRTQSFFLLSSAGVGLALLFGCSVKDPYPVNPASGLPPTVPAVTSNTYIGTQNPLNWTLAIDDKQNAYSYRSLPKDGSTAAATSGTYFPQSGFLNLGSAGLALELPGAGVILRPGNNTTAPVAMVEQEGCIALSGQKRFLLQSMVLTNEANSTIYRRGDFIASTSSNGKTWSFANAEYVDPNGNQISLNYQGLLSAGSFTGTCVITGGQSSVGIDTTGAYYVPTTFRFGSAGMGVADYTTSSGPSIFEPAAAIGLAQPLYPISTKSLAAASFRGFQVEYSNAAITQPISFGPATDGSAALNGGVYPNDDVTQTADASDLFQFGSQSLSINGLFTNATMTVLDPFGGCPSHNVSASDIGFTPTGIPTCRLHLSAMVGQIGAKAVIVATASDLTQTGSTLPEIQFYLIQQ